MRVKLTEKIASSINPGEQRFDDVVRGFGMRALPSGRVSFFIKYVDKASGNQRLLSLGKHGDISVDQARTMAEKMRGRIAEGKDPALDRKIERQNRGKAETVGQLLDEFLKRYVQKRKLRSEDEYRRVFDHDVKPALGKIAILALKRTDIVRMLDKIEDRGAPVMADRALAHLRSALNWHAARDESFTPPIVKGMARTRGIALARSRVLSDMELRALWHATSDGGAFNALIRFLLLTAARRDEAAGATWTEIARDGTWVIPEGRYKTGISHDLPLSKQAMEILESMPKLGKFIFTTHGTAPFSGFSKSKASLDGRMSIHLNTPGRISTPHALS